MQCTRRVESNRIEAHCRILLEAQVTAVQYAEGLDGEDESEGDDDGNDPSAP